MTGFTKGPWDLIDSENYTAIFGKGYEKPIGTLDSYSKGFGPGKDERLSNAHLISAAPELYEALEDIINWFQSEYGESDRLKAGLSALDKARGSQS